MQLLGTGAQRAGKTSRVQVGGTALTFASYNVDLTGEDYPTVNFESYDTATNASYDEGILGPIGAEIKFGGDWDAATNPLDDPPGLYPRDDLTGVLLWTSTFDLVAWEFPYMRVRSSSNGSEIHGKVTFATSGRNQGVFLVPTGSV